MGVPSIGKKGGKKEKKSGVLNGKIEKKKEKLNKGIEQVTAKRNKGKKGKKGKQLPNPNAIKEGSVLPGSPPSKQVKKEKEKEISQKANTSALSLNSKLEKKNKLSKLKKAKNASKVPEVVTNVSSSKKDKKKKSKKNKKARKEETASTDGASQPQVEKQEKKEKKKGALTPEQEEKIQARRIEKLKAWHQSIDFLLKKKLPKDQVELIKKSKKYTKLPVWKKPYILWVKSDPQYKDQKHAALIKKVYKVLKGAERKTKRNKQKGGQQSTPEPTQAAIERCVKMAASQGPDSPVVGKEVKAEEALTNKVIGKQKEGKGGKNKNKNVLMLKQKKQADNKESVMMMKKSLVKQEKPGQTKSAFKQKKDVKNFKENGLGRKNKKFMKKVK